MNTEYTKKQRSQRSSGFTLVETLVAISILMITIMGPMTIAAKSLQNSYLANERVTAVYLAQEAIESFEKLRDDYALEVFNSGSGDTWGWYDEGGTGNPIHPCKTGTGCDYDVLNDDYIQCSSPESCLLRYDENATQGYYYFYGPSSLPYSKFTREIHLEEHSDPSVNAVEITVTVTWDSTILSSNATRVVLKTWLYDNYNRFE